MLTAVQPDLPTIPPSTQLGGGSVIERLDNAEKAIQALLEDRRRLIEAMRGMWDTLNQDGALGDVKSWTPAITFTTAGDLSVTYTNQIGQAVNFGPFWLVLFDIITSAFTHTTASGNLKITGNPVTNRSTALARGSMIWAGITKANYTEIGPYILTTGTDIFCAASGSGQAASDATAADMPSGGTVRLRGSILLLS